MKKQPIGRKQSSGRLSKVTAEIEALVTSASISAVTLDNRLEPCFRPMDFNVEEQMSTEDQTTTHCCFLETFEASSSRLNHELR